LERLLFALIGFVLGVAVGVFGFFVWIAFTFGP
jgi:hypothetical protein